jgi:hypothetical protein
MSIFRRHRHRWVYSPRTAGGWGMVRCETCKQEDIY